MRAGEERGQLQGVDLLLEGVGLAEQFRLERLVLAGQFLERLEVGARGERLVERLEDGIHPLELGDGGLRLLG